MFLRSGYLLLIASFFLHVNFVYAGEELPDYDKFCEVVTHTTNKKGFKQLNPAQQAEKVNTALSETFKPNSKITKQLSMLQLVDPKQKYTLFKEAAEEALGRPWECQSFRKLNESLSK